MVSVSRQKRDGGRHTRYFYGETLKAALAHAGNPKQFCYSKFERGPVSFGESVRPGVIATTTYRKRKAA